MEWLVYNENFNRQTIEPVNILRNYDDKIKQLKKKSKSYENFSERLRDEMMWQYWARCEYEVLMFLTDDGRIILRPWISPKKEDIYLDVTDDENFDWSGFVEQYSKRNRSAADGVKIDIYDQLKYRWDDFCKYCWNLGR